MQEGGITLSMAVNIKAVNKLIDSISVGHDAEVKGWKGVVAATHPKPCRRALFAHIESNDSSSNEDDSSEEETSVSDTNSVSNLNEIHLPLDDLLADDDDDWLLASDDDDSEHMEEASPTETEVHAERRTNRHANDTGFTLCFDNVNQKTTARHQTREHQNKMFNLVQAYGAKDRVPCLQASDIQPTPEDIEAIPIDSFVPSCGDIVRLRDEFSIMVQRILVAKMPLFEPLHGNIQWHIEHAHAKESDLKSTMIPLGVMDKDETKIRDMIDVVEAYHRYVPESPTTGKPITILLYGDGLSCERVNDAQNSRINADNSWDRLDGIQPAIQEWHRRALQLQDTFDDLFSGSSARDAGTLYYIRNAFKRRNVETNVIKCFNHASELMKFATEGYVVASACTLLGIDDPQEVKHTKDHSIQSVFDKVVTEVVALAFHPPDVANILDAAFAKKI